MSSYGGLPGQGGDFAKGASGPANVYDNSPTGLGINPSYLAGGATASASAAAGSATVSASKPSSPTDAQQWVYLDATNHFCWHFVFQTSDSYWYFIGGGYLRAEVLTSETTTSATYAALSTTGPTVTAPFAGDYEVQIGALISSTANGQRSRMSYDIGGTGAVDADNIQVTQAGGVNNAEASAARTRTKTGLSASTALTAKYRGDATVNSTFANRFISIQPVRIS